ncbi:hypothetical protein IW262DRAFT_1291220 [Armillaria fumosa]|nr:hypothetical protein IW262DRAFT_1291220 [Armillaria fumosa]
MDEKSAVALIRQLLWIQPSRRQSRQDLLNDSYNSEWTFSRPIEGPGVITRFGGRNTIRRRASFGARACKASLDPAAIEMTLRFTHIFILPTKTRAETSGPAYPPRTGAEVFTVRSYAISIPMKNYAGGQYLRTVRRSSHQADCYPGLLYTSKLRLKIARAEEDAPTVYFIFPITAVDMRADKIIFSQIERFSREDDLQHDCRNTGRLTSPSHITDALIWLADCLPFRISLLAITIPIANQEADSSSSACGWILILNLPNMMSYPPRERVNVENQVVKGNLSLLFIQVFRWGDMELWNHRYGDYSTGSEHFDRVPIISSANPDFTHSAEQLYTMFTCLAAFSVKGYATFV